MERTLFYTGGHLAPGDPAFAKDIYLGERYVTHNFGVDFHEPQVIASPKASGKTTLAYVMRECHNEYAYGAEVFLFHVSIPLEAKQKVSKIKLRSYLNEKLKPREESSLISLLSTSNVLESSNGRKVLHIENTERLEVDALTWLLTGIREIINNDSIRFKLKVQVILDGSTELHSLTAGRNSRFPMRQIYPLEFSQDKFRSFVSTRFQNLQVNIEESAIEALWEITHGDKYLVQKLCQLILKILTTHDSININLPLVSLAISDYLSSSTTSNSLEAIMVEQIYELERYYFTHKQERFPWQNIHDIWDTGEMDNLQKESVYEAGLVRRVRENEIELRAPIIISLVEEVRKRVHHVRVIIQNNIAIDGIPIEQRQAAKEVISNIEKSAALGNLSDLHVGTGKIISNGLLKIEATALNKGDYKGIIKFKSKISAEPIGSELWVIIWGVEENNELISKFNYFKMVK